MLSSSPRADIEDEKRQYFKANAVPVESLPEPIWLSVLTNLLWTAQTWRFMALVSFSPHRCDGKD